MLMPILKYGAPELKALNKPVDPAARFSCKMQSWYGEGPEVDILPLIGSGRKGLAQGAAVERQLILPSLESLIYYFNCEAISSSG